MWVLYMLIYLAVLCIALLIAHFIENGKSKLVKKIRKRLDISENLWYNKDSEEN